MEFMMTELDDIREKYRKDRQRLWARQAEKGVNEMLKGMETIMYTTVDYNQLGGENNWKTMRKLIQTIDLLNELYVELPINFDPEYRKGDENDGTKTNR